MVVQYIDVGNAAYQMARIIQRQASTSTSFTLSLGAIIGIACGGGVLIFGLLTFILMHFARRRHKRRRKARKRLILEDGDPEVIEAVRATRPPRLDLSGSYHHDQVVRSLRSAPAESTMYQDDDMTRGLLLPQPSYQVTGHRNSWPLITQTPGTSTSNNADVPHTAQTQNRKPEQSAQRWFDQQLPGIEMQNMPHVKTPSPTRRNFTPRTDSNSNDNSANHLSAILRSTSQRLRATKPGLPRTTSALSQISGKPPSSKAPSPEKHAGSSRLERMRETTAEREEYEESIRSSVLNLFSSPPSPSGRRKSILENGKDITTPTRKKRKSSSGNDSEEDSLYGDTPEVAVPAYLTSPSKPSDKQHRAQMASIDAQATMISGHNRTSTQAFGGREIVTDRPHHTRTQSDDPFVEEALSKSLKNTPIRPNIGSRQPTFGPTSVSASSMSVAYFPIQKYSGSSSSPPRRRVESDASSVDPFKWDNRSQVVVKQSPNPQLPVVLGSRASQRSNMVRISGMDQPRSVNVLDESLELDAATPAASRDASRLATGPSYSRMQIVESAASPTSRNMQEDPSPGQQTKTSLLASQEPQSVRISASDDSPVLGGLDTIATANRHSAANSIYDYYATAVDSASDQSAHPPRLSSKMKKASPYREAATPKFVFPSPSLPGITPEEDLPVSDDYFNEQSIQMPTSFLNHSSSSTLAVPKVNPTAPIASRVQGPREKPHQAARESVQASIAALRRMNSTVSSYSNATSYVSDNSPTLPPARHGGASLQKEQKVTGSRNYMAMGRYTSTLADKGVLEESPQVPALPQLSEVKTTGTVQCSPEGLSGPYYTVEETRGRNMTRAARRAENQKPTPTNDYLSLPKIKHNSSLQSNTMVPTPDQEYFDARSSTEDSDISPGDVLPTPVTPQKHMKSSHLRNGSTQYDMDREQELHSSGLKIQGLKLPLRDSNGSPLKSFNESIFAVDAASHRAVEVPSQNAPYGNPGNFQNSGVKSDTISAAYASPANFPNGGVKSNTNSMMSGLSTAAVVDVKTQSTPKATNTRWSSQTPQPPAGMSANRPDSQSKFAQPLAISANTTKWGSGWETNEMSPTKPVVSDHVFAAYTKEAPLVDENSYDKTYESEASSKLSPVARQVKHHAQKQAREKNAGKTTSRVVSGGKTDSNGRVVSGEKSKDKKKSWLKSPIGGKPSPTKEAHTSFTPSGNADTFDWQKFMSRNGAAPAEMNTGRTANAFTDRGLAEKPRLPSDTHPAFRDEDYRSPPKAPTTVTVNNYHMPLTPPEEDREEQPSPSIMVEGTFMSPRAVPTPAPSHSRSFSQGQSALSSHTRSESQVYSLSSSHTHSSNEMSDKEIPEQAIVSQVPYNTMQNTMQNTRKPSQSLRTGQSGRRGTAANIAKNLPPLQTTFQDQPVRAPVPIINPSNPTIVSKARLAQTQAASTTQAWAAKNTDSHALNSNARMQTKPEGFNTRMFETMASGITPTNKEGWIAAVSPPELSPNEINVTAQQERRSDGNAMRKTEADFYDGRGFFRTSPMKDGMRGANMV